MESLNEYLSIIDVPSIKEYVFGTDRLAEIRGASAILDHLNRVETEVFLKKQLLASNVECIYSNGGSAQFILRGTKRDIVHALENLRGYFLQQSSGGLKLVYGLAPLSNTTYIDALESAFLSLREARDGHGFISSSSLHTGYMRECESCSSPAANAIYSYSDEERVLCDVCARKYEYGKKQGLWKELSKSLSARRGISEKDPTLSRPENFEEIGELCRAPKGYTALVYADGNGMGRLIKAIESPDQFRFFSKTVDESMRQACFEAIDDCCSPTSKIPADILLLGGDDLLVYITADHALPFAINVAKKFTEKTKNAFHESSYFTKLLEGRGLSASLGIAYGKSHTPFAIMLDQAEELLRSAKTAGAKDPRATILFAPSYIDYHFTSSFNQVSIKDCRIKHLQIPADKLQLLHQKPYSLEDAEVLLYHARRIVELGVPKTKLHRFSQTPSMGKINSTLEFLRLYTRISEVHRSALHQALDHFGCMVSKDMPWRTDGQQYTTVLLDLVELTALV